MIFRNPYFVEIDVILRRGGHINRSDITLYQFMCNYFEDLKSFYEKYQCVLIQHPDGFFVLLSHGGILKTRILPKTCMHLGQFLALKMLDPEMTRLSGKLTIGQLLQFIENTVPRETLQAIYAPKQRESLQYERITEEIIRALDKLKDLRFVKIAGETIKPTEAIYRFMEMARHDNHPDVATREMLTMQRGAEFIAIEDTEAQQEDGEGNESED